MNISDKILTKFNKMYREVIDYYKLDVFSSTYGKQNYNVRIKFLDISRMGHINFYKKHIPDDINLHTSFFLAKKYYYCIPFQKFAISVIYNKLDDIKPEYFIQMNENIRKIRNERK